MAQATGRKAPGTAKAAASKKSVVVKKAAPAKAAASKVAAKKTAASKAVKKVAAKAPKKAGSKAAPAAKQSGSRRSTPAKKAAPGKTSPGKTSPAKKPMPAPSKAKKSTPAKASATSKKKAAVSKTPAVAKATAKAVAPKKPTPEPKVALKKQPTGKTCSLSGIFVPKQSPNITPKTLEKLHEQLMEERARHVRQAEDLQADADALVDQREQGDTQFDEESGEGDTISVERERDLMLSATARLAVDEIDLALARMTAGTYGLCNPAGRRIPVARLEAIPWADTCVDCKQRVERRR